MTSLLAGWAFAVTRKKEPGDDISHAIEVLSRASERCQDEDMRTDEVFAALDYLDSVASRKTALMALRNGLDVQHPEQRRQVVASAVRSIRRAVGSRDE